ncbi:hypothetical protein M3876_07665 [Rothia kristinae]|nr:hypothetical protein [Rothia kristinae]MCT1393133.1 hypothetical protein [Rothia kristinae]MCT1506353.1 hypothetical protein [Rothia kristinae]MCT2038806.1 hypothetical protein [Rothia kristinae]MCT2243968.1 hypothetical protein [Rothia kristinae]
MGCRPRRAEGSGGRAASGPGPSLHGRRRQPAVVLVRLLGAAGRCPLRAGRRRADHRGQPGGSPPGDPRGRGRGARGGRGRGGPSARLRRLLRLGAVDLAASWCDLPDVARVGWGQGVGQIRSSCGGLCRVRRDGPWQADRTPPLPSGRSSWNSPSTAATSRSPSACANTSRRRSRSSKSSTTGWNPST